MKEKIAIFEKIKNIIEIELNEEKNKNKKLNEMIIELKKRVGNINQSNKILELESEIKKYKSYFLSSGEELLTLNLISTDQNINNYTLYAKNNDTFTRIEEMIYKKILNIKRLKIFFF